MFEKTQHLQFPVSPFRRRETLKNVRHLLQSDPLSIPRICHRPEITRKYCQKKATKYDKFNRIKSLKILTTLRRKLHNR